MCGITGWIDWEEDLRRQGSILDKMVSTLSFRGPDASGKYLAEHAAIGHRRLSVVDLEGGRQPMLRQWNGQEFVITYNGELYNTPELRSELASRGYSFSTSSDTEVLLMAFIEWGPECVDKLNGIFAFAVWDVANERLFMARDRLGVKPLFYTERCKGIIFGSELKALLAHPSVPPEIDAAGLAEIFMIGPARTPGHGVFRGVNELKPGWSMLYDRNGMHLNQYWQLSSKPHTDDFSTTCATVHDLLKDSVTRQLVADVPVCTLLSGGLDSSALTAFAAQHYEVKNSCLHTYSVDYVDNQLFFKADSFQPNDDAPWINRVSGHFGTCHHRILLDNAELAHSLTSAAVARDLPGMADVDASLMLFCREIKKGATVALSGECADEVFGGYPWFRRDEFINADTFPWSRAVEDRIEWLAPAVSNVISPREYVANRYQEALQEVPRLPGEDASSARMREIFYLSLTRFMPTLLDRKDRMSMAFGLEVRVPFCDHRLVEYVWNVPWTMKNYENREKGLLRHALTGLLPEDVLWRRKSPYPKTHNPAYLENVRSQALSLLDDEQSLLSEIVNVGKMRELAETAGTKPVVPWFGQLMGTAQLFAYLIQLDTWLKAYQVKLVI